MSHPTVYGLVGVIPLVYTVMKPRKCPRLSSSMQVNICLSTHEIPRISPCKILMRHTWLMLPIYCTSLIPGAKFLILLKASRHQVCMTGLLCGRSFPVQILLQTPDIRTRAPRGCRQSACGKATRKTRYCLTRTKVTMGDPP